MADYTIKIVSDSANADKDLERLERRARELEKKPFKVDIQLPSLAQTVDGVKQLGTALQFTYGIARNVVPQLRDVDDLGRVLQNTAERIKTTLSVLSQSTPTRILGSSFEVVAGSAEKAATSISRVGYVVFGLTQSVNLLKATYSGFFDQTIGREIRLQETLLRTKTTLISTNNVLKDGIKIDDPFKALKALDKPIEDTISNIRRRSLDIAGTTSDAIIQTFGIVSSQIGSIGGDLKDAENLAISFAAALGTIGLSDPAYATQEVGSILRGDVGPDSILARSLAISNADIAKAKQNGELIEFITKKLAGFTAGQKVAAASFSGLTSNIQEFNEELARSFGKPILEPLLQGLDSVYKRISTISKPAMDIADALGRSGAALASGIGNAVSQAPTVVGLDTRAQTEAINKLKVEATSFFLLVQEQLDKLRPALTALIDNALRGAAMLGKGIAELAKGFAQFKFEEFKIFLGVAVNLGKTLNATVVPALSKMLSVYGELLKLPVVQYLTQFNAQMQVLERIGALPFARLVYVLPGLIKSLGMVTDWIKNVISMIGTGLRAAFSAVAAGIAGLSAGFVGLGQAIVSGFNAAVGFALKGISAISVQLGQLLLGVASSIQAAYPALGGVVVAINKVALSLINVSESLDMVKYKFFLVSQDAIKELAKLEIKAEQVKAKVASIGDNIGAGFNKAAGAVTNFARGMLMSLLWFGAQMLIINAGITLLVDQLGRWQRRQEEMAKTERTELALKRLATTYKNIGDESSYAARKGKEFEQQLVSARYEELTQRLEELRKKIEQINRDMAKPGINTFNEGKIAYEAYLRELIDFAKANPIKIAVRLISGDITGVMAEFYNKFFGNNSIGKEQKRQLTEAQKEAAAARKEQDKINRAEDLKQLESNIKLESSRRMDISKQLADFERQHKTAMFQLDQQAAQQRIDIFRLEGQMRINAVVDQNAKLIENEQGLAKVILDNLNTYIQNKETGELEIEASKKNIVIEINALERSMADYKWETEKRSAELRKQMGDYERKMADYKYEKAVLEGKARAGTTSDGSSVTGAASISDIADKSLNANARAHLATLSYAEGTSGPNGYRTMFGGGLFNDMSKHPDRVIRSGGYASTAAGKYQFLSTTWNDVGGGPMTPERQDKAAMALALRAGVDLSTAPFTPEVAAKLAPIWASYPKLNGQSAYGQPVKDFNRLQSVFKQNLAANQQGPNTAPGRPIGQIDMLGGRPVMWNGVAYVPAGGATGSTPSAGGQPVAPAMPDIGAISSRAVDEQRSRIETQISQIKRLQELQAEATRANSAKELEGLVKKSITVPNFAELDNELIRLQEQGAGLGSALNKAFDPQKQQLINDMTADMRIFDKAMETIANRLKDPKFKLPGTPEQQQQLRETLNKQLAVAREMNRTNLINQLEKKEKIIDQSRANATNEKLFLDATEVKKNADREILSLQGSIKKALVGTDDPLRNRMLDAEQAIKMKELEISQDNTLSLEQATEKLNDFKEITYRAATELGMMERVAKTVQEKLALVKEISGTISGGFKSVFASLLRGGDVSEALTKFGQEASEKLMGRFIDFAFKPLEDQMEKMFKQFLGLNDPEVAARTDNTSAVRENTAALRASNKIVPGPTGGLGVASDFSFNPQASSFATLFENQGQLKLPDFSWTADLTTEIDKLRTAAIPLPDTLEANNIAFNSLSSTLNTAPEAAKQANNSFQNVVGGVATMAASIAGIASGFSQIKKGGTGNILSGIGSIFMGISGAISGFGSISKAFGGARAKGGRVAWDKGYLVGEEGPEWFEPDSNGQITSNKDLATMARRNSDLGVDGYSNTWLRRQMANADTAGSRRNMPTFNFNFETKAFGGEEWISRSQVEEMMRETERSAARAGARQGMAMTMDKLQNSSSTRRRLAI